MITFDIPTLLRYKTKCHDKPLSQLKELDEDFVAQLKVDGWWCLVTVDMGICTVYNVGGRALWNSRINELDNCQGVLIGEAGYGTNWALNRFPGKVYIHDVIWWNRFDCQDWIYAARKERLERIFGNNPFMGFMIRLPVISIDNLAVLWNGQVMEGGWEGVVVKNLGHKFGQDFFRCKRQVTMDYVCMGFSEGGGKNKGKAGNIRGGLYVNGKLKWVCSIGGGMTDTMRAYFWSNPEQYVGKVFEAKGASLFDSGALRHPQFKSWREDKLAEECVL